MLNIQPLTTRQIRRLETLPEHHEVVSTRDGAPVVRGPRGRLLRVERDGHMEGLVDRVQSYLHVNG